MVSLVKLIQNDAQDNKVPVSALLRRVKTAAVKLKLDSVESWVDQELNGYNDTISDYRMARGAPQVLNPYNGWIPLVYRNTDFQEIVSRKPCAQKLAEIEDLLAAAPHQNNFHMPFSPRIMSMINQNSEFDWPRGGLEVPRSFLVGIIDAVRNKILDWALDLERAGVMGEDMKFSREEQHNAHNTTINIREIRGFSGAIGVRNTFRDIDAVYDFDGARKVLDAVEKNYELLTQNGFPSDRLDEAVTSLKSELTNRTPDKSVVSGAVNDIRAMATGAAGNLAADGLLSLISSIFGA